MKKSNYHVNPAVNKWEEEQRRARMEKMIQRAKSTLPPEARGGAKASAPKKPSPYTTENNAAKPVRKRSTTGGQGTPSGPVAVDVQELDGLIYNRVQEILGMPLMQRAAAARAAPKGGAPPKPSALGRGGRRPAWNEDWNAQVTGSPQNNEERHVGGVGSKSGASNATYERSPSKLAAAPKPKPSPTHGAPMGTPNKGSRIPMPSRIEVPASGNSSSGLQRRLSGRAPGAAEERVVLLPSPSPAAAANRAGPHAGRPPSSRYGSGAGAPAMIAAAGETPENISGHLLEQSVVAAIEALNPHAPAVREAASRIGQHQHQQSRERQAAGPGTGASAGQSGFGAAGTSHGSFRGSGDAGGAAAVRNLSGSASILGAGGRDRDASLMQSVAAAAGASQGGSLGLGSSVTASSSRRPPLVPAPRASGRGMPQATAHVGGSPKDKEVQEEEGDEDAYADDDFEEYDGTDDERGAAQDAKTAADECNGEGDEGGGEGAASADPDVALLRHSVNALNGLVQLKIQHELARSQQQPTPASAATHKQVVPQLCWSSQAGGAGSAGGGAMRQLPGAEPDVLASLALAGSEEPSVSHAPGRGDPANSSLGDGLRQSDLDYLARLGGGDPHDGIEVATSTDERPFVIEPGAPAGTAKAWGDRQPWSTGKDGDSEATGLLKLRARQEREKERQQPVAVAPAAGRHQQRLSQQRLSKGMNEALPAAAADLSKPLHGAADEEDSVLLGETFSPRHRTGAAAQMQVVSSALAALASSGQLTAEDAKDLRSQTDALYGSLVQLHNLMNGPRGVELCSSSPSSSNGGSGGGAKGFTPTELSPATSPGQTARRSTLAVSSGKPTQVQVEPVPHESEDGVQQPRKPSGGAGAHLQLTPKHQLIAEDVAWMAGLVHSLSRSLHVENGEVDLPGV